MNPLNKTEIKLLISTTDRYLDDLGYALESSRKIRTTEFYTEERKRKHIKKLESKVRQLIRISRKLDDMLIEMKLSS